jgi:hypothetical protein
MVNNSAIDTLTSLLQESSAKPILNARRFAPSAVYDLQYRMLVIGAAFEIHSKPFGPIMRRILAPKLKLLQFIAFRPWLVPVVRNWSETQGFAQQSMFSEQQLRRGFISDETHDEVVEFLIARRALDRMDRFISDGPNLGFLRELQAAANEGQMFQAAFDTLRELSDITISNAMLEGW